MEARRERKIYTRKRKRGERDDFDPKEPKGKRSAKKKVTESVCQGTSQPKKVELHNLPEELILKSTEYLPDKDKVGLMDLFPGVANQVKTFDLNLDGVSSWRLKKITEQHRLRFKKLVQFKKLKRLKRLKLADGHLWALNRAALTSDCIIESFAPFDPEDSDAAVTKKMFWYIENRLEKDSSYDGSEIKNTLKLVVSTKLKILQLLNKFPNLKLKLSVEGQNIRTKTLDLIESDERIRKLVTVVDIQTENPNERLESITFPNLTVLKLNQESLISRNQVESLQKLQKLEKLEIEADNRLAQFVPDLLRIPNLKSLGLYFHGNFIVDGVDMIQNIVIQLLATESGLTSLSLTRDGYDWDIAKTLEKLTNKKCGFHFFELEAGGDISLYVSGSKVKLFDPLPSYLHTIMNKFPKTKHIIVWRYSWEKYDCLEMVEPQLGMIRSSLPRNRCLQFTFEQVR